MAGMSKKPHPPEPDLPPEAVLENLPDWFRQREVIPLEDNLALVVSHETMRGVVALCRDMAEHPAPLLLTGETGVGKSLLARFLHASRDPYAPYASLLAAGLEGRALAARLFGDAGEAPEGTEQAQGLVRETAGGTLVLEEVAELPPDIQTRLLELWSAGGPEDSARPAQWVCTTNADEELREKTLLPEFLERLRRIHVPPLRERREDIPALVAYFSRLRASRQASLGSLETLAERLKDYGFPGNVRELESLMTLEASGLPWRWRVTGGERRWGLKPKVVRS